MASVNQVNLLGNLTNSPELRYLPSGDPVCSVGMAVNKRYFDKEGAKKESVMFIGLDAFKGTAKAMSEFLSKGDQVFVQGELRFRKWEHEGRKHSKHTVAVKRIEFLKTSRKQAEGAPTGAENGDPKFVPDGDEVPF